MEFLVTHQIQEFIVIYKDPIKVVYLQVNLQVELSIFWEKPIVPVLIIHLLYVLLDLKI